MSYLKLATIAGLVLLEACAVSPGGGSPSEGGTANGSGPSERVFGTVEYYGEPAQVKVPSSVGRGQPFVVTVVTYGGDCTEKGETKVEVEGTRAEVRPYDYDISSPDRDCTDELRLHEHTATLSFEETGTAEIIFFGKKESSSGVTQTSITRTLEVR